MEYSGAGGKLIHEKNQKQKISWHCPFKLVKSATKALKIVVQNIKNINEIFAGFKSGEKLGKMFTPEKQLPPKEYIVILSLF